MTISLLARRHRDAEGLVLYRCVFSFFFFFLFFSTPSHWTDLNQTWTYIHTWFTYDCYLKNLVLSLLGVYDTRAWAKTAFWDRLRTLTENISAKEQWNIISNKQSERNSSIYKDSPPPNFGPQTAKNDGRISAHPLKITRRMSCRLTFARHFGLIIFVRWCIWSTQMPRAWLTTVGEAARRAGSRWALPCI